MKVPADLLHRLRRLARLGLARDEITEELRFHLSMEAARLEASGKSRAEAERIALESFGDPRVIELECRQIRGGKAEDTAFEIRSAARTLTSDRRVTSIAFAGLTIALALLAVAFSLADATLLKPLPYSGADRIVRLWSSVPGVGPDARWGIAKAQFQFFRREARNFSHMGLYRYETVTARAGDHQASQVAAMVTSAGTLGVLGVRPLLGQGFSPDDNLAEAPRVALLSYSAWERLYSRNLRVVGQTLEVNGSTVKVVGVLPQAIAFPEEIENAEFSPPDVLLPLRLNPSDPPQNNHVYRGVALLRPGVEHEAAAGELNALVARLPGEMPAAYPRSFMKNTRFGVEVVPLKVETQEGSVPSFVMMLVAASLLLTLACAAAWNVPVRQPGERLSPFSTEMVILVAGSAVVALVLASILLGLSPAMAEKHSAGLTLRTAAFTLSIAGIAATFLAATRSSKPFNDGEQNIVPLLTQGVIALPLVVFAAILARELNALKTTSPGFDTTGVVATTIHLPATRYSSHHAVSAFETALTQRLRSTDRVAAAGLTSSLPLTGFDGCSGVTADRSDRSRCVPVYFVSAGYLSTLGVSVSGREATSNNEAVVSSAFAGRTWPGLDPVGRTISLGPSSGSYEVVGVADDVRSRGLDREAADDVYVPLTPQGGLDGWPPIKHHTLVVRSSYTDQGAVRQLVLDAIRAVDGSVEAGATRSMAEIVDADTAHRDLPVSFISIAALAAITLWLTSVQSAIGRSRARIHRHVQPIHALQLHDY